MKTPWTKQPQYQVGIDWDNPLTKNLAACFNGPSGFEFVHRRHFPANGSPKAVPIASGMAIQSTVNGASFDGRHAPENTSGSRSAKAYDPVSPPITLFIVGNSKSDNLGAGLFRQNGSGTPAFSLFFWEGSQSGASFSVKTSGGQIAFYAPSTTKKTNSGFNVAVCSIGTANSTIYCSNGQKDTYSTPSGNFYYEYSDKYRCLSYGGSYSNSSGNIALAGLVSGRAWTEQEVYEFMSNPWQIFAPLERHIPFPVGSAPQLLVPISDVSAGLWTPSSGSDLYAMLDESAYSDTDYIVSSTPSTCEMRVTTATDPAVSTGHVLRYRLLAGDGSITAILKQGSTTIASYGPHTLTGSAQDFAQTLAGGEADSITDYGDLRVVFTSS